MRGTAPRARGKTWLPSPRVPPLNRVSLRQTPGRIVAMEATILKRFDTPDEVREMVKGRFEVVHIGGMTIGHATYQPGWKWSEHVGPAIGASRCSVEHVGLVVS